MMADDDHHHRHHHHQTTAVTSSAVAFPHHQEQELHGEQEDDNGGEEDLLLTDGPNHHHPTTFSQLLFSSHHQPHNASAATTSSFGLNDINSIYNLHNNNTSSSYPPQMLCFGSTDPQGVVCVLPSPKINTTSSSNRKREGLTPEQSLNSVAVTSSNATDSTDCGPPPPEARQRASKRSRTDKSTPSPRPRKEKLGERIATLQQLVSPFGKTDTASVLHEAMGYIRFLQDQIQVLCSPYLQSPPPSTSAASPEGNHGVLDNKNKKRELRSRGLCLVPVECTIHVANSNNGADFWSPAAAAAMGTNHNITSTTTATSSCFLSLPTTQ